MQRPGEPECDQVRWIFLPPDSPSGWQLIEFNDNGAGLLLAALVNRLFYDLSGLAERPDLAAPPRFADFCERIADIVDGEARAVGVPGGALAAVGSGLAPTRPPRPGRPGRLDLNLRWRALTRRAVGSLDVRPAG